MKLLFDINILLDVILDRSPWAPEAALLLTAVEKGNAAGFVAAHSITTIYYLVAKQKGPQAAATAITDLLRIVHVVPLSDADFQQALVLGLADFEDAVHAAAALQIGADYLVTRNTRDFTGLTIAVRTAGEVVALL